MFWNNLYFFHYIQDICIWGRQTHNVHLNDEWISVILCKGKMDSVFLSSIFIEFFNFYNFVYFLYKSECQFT